jgi:hypothetical protein
VYICLLLIQLRLRDDHLRDSVHSNHSLFSLHRDDKNRKVSSDSALHFTEVGGFEKEREKEH